jgi:rhamnulokinase
MSSIQDAKKETDHRPPATDHCFIAVDLGAGSGRVFLCGLGDAEFMLEETHRFTYPPIRENGHLRWDFPKILSEIKFGLKKAAARAAELNRKIYSLGVDSWAVDYGLLGADGRLLENPVCYRDARTEGAMEKVFALVPRAAIFERTGIQFLNFNTLFQLFSDHRAQEAEKILLLPDLINYFLTGRTVAEYTNATTTQLVDARTREWDSTLLEKLKLPAKALPEIVPAGTFLGELKPDIAAELNLRNVLVTATATHDTASAVAGAPLEKNWAYISSGTWSLVGIERTEALINRDTGRHNFTNEGGACGTVRFLKNVMGLWILERCREEWSEFGVNTDYGHLLNAAGSIEDFQGFIFPDDERFLNPPGMIKALAGQLNETGQILPDEAPVIIAKIILDSLAFRYASVIETIEKLTGEKIAGVQIVGGGGRNDYLNRMTANASGKPVKAGLTEATVTGNAIVQAIAAGRFAGLTEARGHVAKNIQLKTFAPQRSARIAAAKEEYRKIENLFARQESAAV